MEPNNKRLQRLKAEEKVREIKGFYIHLFIYYLLQRQWREK